MATKNNKTIPHRKIVTWADEIEDNAVIPREKPKSNLNSRINNKNLFNRNLKPTMTSVQHVISYIQNDISLTRKHAPNQKFVWLRFDERVAKKDRHHIKRTVEEEFKVGVVWLKFDLVKVVL